MSKPEKSTIRLSIADLADPDFLGRIARPSDLRSGGEIAREGEVELLDVKPGSVVARVKPVGGVRRTVTLCETPRGLSWKCSCSSRKDFFCKHCVAAGIVASAASR
jgi:uncharacterized Zn finger protein